MGFEGSLLYGETWCTNSTPKIPANVGSIQSTLDATGADDMEWFPTCRSFKKHFTVRQANPWCTKMPAEFGDLTVNLGSINGYVAAMANLLGRRTEIKSIMERPTCLADYNI